MNKDGHPENEAGDEHGRPDDPLAGHPEGAVGGPHEPPDDTFEPVDEEDESVLLELGAPTELSGSLDDALEIGEPAGRAGPSSDPSLELGDPEPPGRPPSDEFPAFGDSSTSGELTLGVPPAEAPEPVVVPRPGPQPPPPTPGPDAPPAPPRRNPMGLLATAAAVLAAATVPSYFVYRSQQAQVETERVQSTRGAELAKMLAEESARQKKETDLAIARQKKEADDAIAAAIAEKEKEAAQALAEQEKKADEATKAAIARQKKEDDDAIARQKKEAEDAIAAAIAKQKEAEDALAKQMQPGPGASTPGGPSFPAKADLDAAVAKIRDARTSAEGIKQVVALHARFGDRVYDEAIARLGEALRTAGTADRLIDACNSAKASDKSHADHYDLFELKLIDASPETPAAPRGARGTGSGRARMVSLQGPPGADRKAKLRKIIDRCNAKLAGTSNIRPSFLATKRDACLELGGLLQDEGKLDEAVPLYNEALLSLKEIEDLGAIQDRLPPGTAPSPESIARLRRDLADLDARLKPVPTSTALVELQKRLERALADLRVAQDRIRSTQDEREAARRAATEAQAGQDAARKSATEAQAERDSARKATLAAQAEEEAARRTALAAQAERDAARRTALAAQAERDAARNASLLAQNKQKAAEQAYDELEKRTRLTADAQVKEAQAKLASLTQKVRGDAFYSYAMAIEDFGQGDYNKADGKLSLAIEWFPTDARFHYFRGISRHLLAQGGKAEEDIRQGARLEPINPDAFGEVAGALSRMPTEVIQWVESIRHPGGSGSAAGVAGNGSTIGSTLSSAQSSGF